MKKIFVLIFLLVIESALIAQGFKTQTFGDKRDDPILFLHGGPGYNSVSFEQTTGDELAKSGFFVISYDRRGEGRNDDLPAKYTFDEAFEDLNKIYEKHDLKSATLIGHSFGGIIATLFADEYPGKLNELILTSVPVSMQKMFQNIIAKSKEIYTKKKDKVNLNYISMLENMDSASLEYATYSFMHAMGNDFYSAETLNDKAIDLYKKFESDSLLKKYASKNESLAPQKFWENEGYTSISIKKNLQNLLDSGVDIYGIYGKEDGLYSKEQVNNLKNILGNDNLKYLENCSHNTFIDRQKKFIDAVNAWIK